jgi:hypothetical protein
MPVDILNQIDKYRRHCLWRGSDLNARKPPLVAQKLVTRPKRKGGLGVIRLRVHNDALLMKYLHKFYSKDDLPSVQLVWGEYYSNGRLLGKTKKGSFWWQSILKLQDIYIGLAHTSYGAGDTISSWEDLWNGSILHQAYPHLYSFSRNK